MTAWDPDGEIAIAKTHWASLRQEPMLKPIGGITILARALSFDILEC